MSAATRRWALQFSVATLFAGTAASAPAAAPLATAETPIGALHRQHRDIAARHDAIDEALLELPDGPEHDEMHKAFVQALDDCLALRARILRASGGEPGGRGDPGDGLLLSHRDDGPISDPGMAMYAVRIMASSLARDVLALEVAL